MPQVNELASEVTAAIEIYFLGRNQQQYNNAAFILCDDYTEIASKVFLLADNPHYSGADVERQKEYDDALKEVVKAAQNNTVAHQQFVDTVKKGPPKDGFKNFGTVLDDVNGVFVAKRLPAVAALNELHDSLRANRRIRNNVFHSPNPLGTTVSSNSCVEAFCNLLDYTHLLFGNEWKAASAKAGKLETYTILLLLEQEAQTNTALRLRIDSIFEQRRRQNTATNKIGAETVRYGHDVYTYLSTWLDADHTLKTALQTLYSSACGSSGTT